LKPQSGTRRKERSGELPRESRITIAKCRLADGGPESASSAVLPSEFPVRPEQSVLQACRIVVFATLFLSVASVLRPPGFWQPAVDAARGDAGIGFVSQLNLRSSAVPSGLAAASEAALGVLCEVVFAGLVAEKENALRKSDGLGVPSTSLRASFWRFRSGFRAARAGLTPAHACLTSLPTRG